MTAVRSAAAFGAGFALAATVGFGLIWAELGRAIYNEEGSAALENAGYVLLFVGWVGLGPMLLFLQVRAGVLALRHDRSPLRRVGGLTLAFVVGATVVLAMGGAVVEIVTSVPRPDDLKELGLLEALASTWGWAMISALVVIGVVELVRRFSRRAGASRPSRDGGGSAPG